jgi:hypothetical protein
MVRLEDDRLDIAAALDPAAVRSAGGLGAAAHAVISSTNFPQLDGVCDLSWRGTPLLRHQPPALAAERAFAIGDATGYFEPITGEGIERAVGSAVAVGPLAWRACREWSPDQQAHWRRKFRRSHSRQWLCRSLAFALRSPWRTAALVRILSAAPIVARPFVRSLNGSTPPPFDKLHSSTT